MSGRKPRRPAKALLEPVALGGEVVREDLPLPWVHYPSLYGPFIAFAETQKATPALCECAQQALEHYRLLRPMHLQRFPSGYSGILSPKDFPPALATWTPAEDRHLRFERRVCHRCNLATPSLRFCHEMYGGVFHQGFGWYIKQNYARLGVMEPDDYLAEVCPEELAHLIKIEREAGAALSDFQSKMEGLPTPYAPDFFDAWRGLQRDMRRARRAVEIYVEDVTRKEFGFRKVGEGWVGETLLHNLLQRVFPGRTILRHHRPEWLEGLEIDCHLPEINLGVEYQGQQHFHAIEAWGGLASLRRLQGRDERKKQLCREHGTALETIDYTEPLTEEHIRQRLAEWI